MEVVSAGMTRMLRLHDPFRSCREKFDPMGQMLLGRAFRAEPLLKKMNEWEFYD